MSGFFKLLLETIKINNNNGNNGHTYQEILNLFFIHGKRNKVLRKLSTLTSGKFRRIEANFMRLGQVSGVLKRPKSAVDNEERRLNILLYFEANTNALIRAADKDLRISKCSVYNIFKKHRFHFTAFYSSHSDLTY